jgi:hypothetical protein
MLTLDIPQEKGNIITQFREFGFENELDLVLYAFDLLEKELKKRKDLLLSAQLYAEIYEEDEDLKFLTESALNDIAE